jgi:predicted DNA-binding transcriptional regulator AlpA
MRFFSTEIPMKPRASPSQPIVVSVDEGRRLAGIGRTKFYELIKQSKLKTVTIGRRRLVFIDSIREMLEAQDC